MRPVCSYCGRRCPSLAPLAVTFEEAIVDACCRRCEVAMQGEFLLPLGSGWDRHDYPRDFQGRIV